jgi:hypothetical protein
MTLRGYIVTWGLASAAFAPHGWRLHGLLGVLCLLVAVVLASYAFLMPLLREQRHEHEPPPVETISSHLPRVVEDMSRAPPEPHKYNVLAWLRLTRQR